jgi:penicillin amidase
LALLAGDPHLDLTLPSIWYEVHLVVPGVLDVAGVTIPGGPAVILGFNRDVAWTATNTGSDALDFYRETVDDSSRPLRYQVDGRWLPIKVRVETFRGQQGEVLLIDTVRYTHRGPMRHVAGQWLSMRWTALEAGRATAALVAAAHARSAASWLDAMQTYDGPTLNWLVADRSGAIAIRSVGVFPTRPGDGRGDEIRDGSRASNDWTGALAVGQLPTSINPAQGYLASANQEPVDPTAPGPGRRRYYGADWVPPWRAMRINALLRSDSAVTPDDMRRWQTDPGSAEADFFVPYFLAAAQRIIASSPAPTTSGSLTEGARLLAEWDRRYTRTNTRAVLLEAAVRELNRRAFAPPATADTAPLLHPSSAILAALVRDSANPWWSAAAAISGLPPARVPAQARDALLAASLAAATDSVRARHGPPAAGGWRWDRVQHTNIYHLLRIPAFSRLDLSVQGGPSTLNPSSGAGTEGASWRMVVELGPEPRAWATYPGGQSGSPVSSRYADRLPQWLSGELDSVRVPHAATQLAPSDVRSQLSLTSP